MVVFTCGHCGESVQKPKVEKHYQTKCRNRNFNLSCMDCFKDFLGNAYESHIKCVTEEERYAGKGFVVKEKKGEKKQQTWVEMLQSVLEEHKNISGNVHRIIDTVSKQTNTPRKKPKFINFVKNCCGNKTNLGDIEQAWALISVKLSELSNQNKNQKNGTVNGNGTVNSNGTADRNGTADSNGTANSNGIAKSNGTGSSNGTGDSKGAADLDPQVENEPTKNEECKEEKSVPIENGDQEQTNEVNDVENKKLSKKQKKEEKKRRKYEAELQSAVAPPIEDEETQVKKGKKKKNRTESLTNADVEDTVQAEGKGKHKKRKRQDTVNGVPDVVENDNENIEPEPVNKEKTQKKKIKIAELGSPKESICYHDENVAKSEEEPVKNGKFDWHSVILSVLEKKGQEIPFKRLQKKVLAEFVEMTGQDVDDRIADKFIKKLKSAPNVKVDKNRVFIQQ